MLAWDRKTARSTLALALVCWLAAAAPQRVRGQGGLSSGGPAGIGGNLANPRGSATNPADGGGSGDPEELGGLKGGERRQGGTIGSSGRGGNGPDPGDPDGSSLGPPLGASGTAAGDNVPGNRPPRTLGGRLGRSIAPAGRSANPARPGQDPATARRLERDRQAIQTPEVDPISQARRPGLELPGIEAVADPGPEDGLTLDAAIDLLLRQNLDLMAQRFEVPKAEADVLTAGLRDNPILYADGQLVPYGNFTRERPGGGGGQPQYDVNVSVPLDFTRKRRERVRVARLAQRVTEAQLQDAARNLVDTLYTAFVNVLAARDSLRLGEAHLARIERDLDEASAAARATLAPPEADPDERSAAADAVVELRSIQRQGHLQVRQAGRRLERAAVELAQVLGLPPGDAAALRVRGRLREVPPPSLPRDELVRQAQACRPDLVAYRLGVARADADVRLARANRFADTYLVYQPYTFQSNHSFGAKGTYTYGVGVNAALPLFNRNQGNIARAVVNADQTRHELAALERRVAYEVGRAVRDVEDGRDDVAELEQQVIPAAVRARDVASQQYRRDASKVGDYVDALGNLDDVVKQYRDALIDQRQDMLDLNTAVGARVLP